MRASPHGNKSTPPEVGRRGTTAILLAAGESSRFRGVKQLARIGGRTLVERALEKIPGDLVRGTVLVVGHEAAAVAEEVGVRTGVIIVLNADYRAGMSGSIRAGILALGSESKGAMILLADQPFVTKALMRRMLRKFEEGGARGIVAATHGGLVTPPAIFSRRYFAELAELRGDQGARSVIDRHPRALTLVNVRSRLMLADIDTREDFDSARGLLEP